MPTETNCRAKATPSLAHIAVEIAAARFRLAVLRYAGEYKFRKDQARVPKGSPGPGRFADEGRGTSHRAGVSAARMAPAAAGRVVARGAARTAAGVAAEGIGITGAVAGGVAAAAPLAVSAGAMSSVTGLATHYMTGAPVTPFLHFSGGADDFRPAFLRGRADLSPDEIKQRDEACEDLYDEDMAQCRKFSKKNPGKAGYSGPQIYAICAQDAFKRRAQCRQRGTDRVTQYLFTGGEQ